MAQAVPPKPVVTEAVVVTSDPGLLPCQDFASRIGQPVPPFDLVDLTGRHWRSSELLGKVVYLNLWMIGCPPCVQEIPDLNKVHEAFAGRADLVMLSVATDAPAALTAFLETHPLKLPLAPVSFDQAKRFALVGGTIGFPTHLILDRAGNLALASRGGGAHIHTRLQASLESVLARPAHVPNR